MKKTEKGINWIRNASTYFCFFRNRTEKIIPKIQKSGTTTRAKIKPIQTQTPLPINNAHKPK